ncbi:MAG: LysE family translocator [Sphingobacteriales bacterium]|nr:LysE family translocator [Sphingobacteriales bacterium]
MISLNDFLLFAFASLMLNITQGNDMLYVATRSTSQGIKAGIVSSLGIMAGCLVHLLAAVVGLSAIIANSAIAFSVIKYLGAAYLFYLGIKSILSKQNLFRVNEKMEKKSLPKIFQQGVITNVLNPKVALFFLAFLPQFIHPEKGNTAVQILLLGSWFNFSGTAVNIVVAVLFGKLGNWLSDKQWFVKWQNKITGFLLIVLGLKVALSSRK